ncbi:MAG: M12 family metallo-peptidase [Vicinamibacterales bacterium]|nr:M12 family metallo-peptidase [Vicinamibacterales bacterium]
MRVKLGWMGIALCAAALLLAISAGTSIRAASSSTAAAPGQQDSEPQGTTTGSSGDGIWTAMSQRMSADMPTGRSIDGPHVVVVLNKPALDGLLQRAPLAQAGRSMDSGVVMTLPMPDGTFARFRVEESPILAPELAAAYPEFRTYHGKGIDDPTSTTRFGWTAAGFHAIVLSDAGSVYIDVHTPGDLQRYVSYRKADYRKQGEGFLCLVDGTNAPLALRPENQFPLSNGGTLRTYRLALAATGEYTAAAGGTKALALARMTATVNRVNGIYEREVAVRITMATGTPGVPTALIFTDAAADPYTNSDASAMLAQNQTTVDTIVGTANYDFGHVFGTGGGGVAYLGSPCDTVNNIKAGGVTGSPDPTGDAFDVDYVAHEMGHQFGGNHTFNGNDGSCGTRSAPHAYEVGSGSTIQAYAGICGVENLQPNTSDYFHVESLDEITAFLTQGGGETCGTAAATGNTPPTVSAGANYTIPQRTPFMLTATGSDANGDTLSYAWEEFNLGTVSNSVASASTDDGSRPLFRSYSPTSSPSRTFPSLTYILNHANVPPTTYACGFGTCLTGEVLPSTNRTMTFQVTARDNRSGGGGITTAAMQATVTTAAGPFRVTAPNAAGTVAGGSATTVTWDVAGTAGAPVSTANVKISLSIDGGTTFPTVLLTSTPNDGSQSVTLPNSASTTARIKVEAVGNIFFDISDTNFTITEGGVGANSAPTATGVAITGSAIVGQTLTGSYTYADADGDLQGISTFRWLRGGSAISGATALTYTLVTADAGQTITFEVTPVAATGVTMGAAVTSTGVAVSAAAVVSASPTSLRFAATKAGTAGDLTAVTNAQAVTVSVTGGTTAWTASANQPWVQITNGAGTNAGQFTVGIINPGNVLGASTNVAATVTITPSVAGATGTTVGITLIITHATTVGVAPATAAPFGQVDTPVQGATGVVGAIGVSGWALDDLAVTGVKIYRNCLPFDNQAGCFTQHGFSMVFIGDAAFVAGARPDVEAAFPTVPQAYRGGWGYLMLTNMLPHVTNSLAYGGQGPLTIYAIATDVEGKTTLLGRTQADATPTTITMANDTIAKPFGAIDTPSQGQTVSGILANFGWVLTPDSDNVAGAGDILVPIDGSTMNVVVDGVAVGRVAYNQCRGNIGNPVPPGSYCDDDVANIFGSLTPLAAVALRSANPTRHRNLDLDRAAIGSFAIDTTLMTNGMHNIAWGVTDSAGRVEGIGSRNFFVLNAGSDPASPALVPDKTGGRLTALVTDGVLGRTGFDFEAMLEVVPADADGVHQVQLVELGRLELHVGAVGAGYLVANGTLRDLPPGSFLDTASGVFTWMPVAGYFGTYRLAFVRTGERVLVDVTVRPARVPEPGESQIRMYLDVPHDGQVVDDGFVVAGWALDPQAALGAGIGAIHVWAQRRDMLGAAAEYLGAAELGGARPDVAQAFGRQFGATGFGLTTAPLPPGVYDITVYVWNRRTARFEDARTVTVTVRF